MQSCHKWVCEWKSSSSLCPCHLKHQVMPSRVTQVPCLSGLRTLTALEARHFMVWPLETVYPMILKNAPSRRRILEILPRWFVICHLLAVTPSSLKVVHRPSSPTRGTYMCTPILDRSIPTETYLSQEECWATCASIGKTSLIRRENQILHRLGQLGGVGHQNSFQH